MFCRKTALSCFMIIWIELERFAGLTAVMSLIGILVLLLQEKIKEAVMDEIWFDFFDEHKRKSYAYKIDADTIKLYDTSLNSDSTEMLLGKLKYKLIKQK